MSDEEMMKQCIAAGLQAVVDAGYKYFYIGE